MTPVSTKTHKCSQIHGPYLSDRESKCRLLFNWTARGWPFLWLGKESATVLCINATLLSISSTLWGWEWVGLRCGAPGKQEGLKSPGWRWHFTLAIFEPGKPQQANRAKADMKIKQGNLLKSNKILCLETTLCIWMHECARNMVPLYLNVPTCLQPITFIWQGSIGTVHTSTSEVLIYAQALVLTFPIIGMSTEPHVSAPQCTIPDAKSAVTIPVTLRERKRKKERMGLNLVSSEIKVTMTWQNMQSNVHYNWWVSLQIMTAELY